MLRTLSIALLSATALTTSALADDIISRKDRTDNLPDKGTITLSGTVEKITDTDEFDLSYDGGKIHVDTNDAWPNIFKADANDATTQLTKGDHVVVTGKIDDNLFSKREIDAQELRFQRGAKIFSYKNDARAKDSMNVSR